LAKKATMLDYIKGEIMNPEKQQLLSLSDVYEREAQKISNEIAFIVYEVEKNGKELSPEGCVTFSTMVSTSAAMFAGAKLLREKADKLPDNVPLGDNVTVFGSAENFKKLKKHFK